MSDHHYMETPRGVLPYLTVRDGHAAIDFYERAFGATNVQKMLADDGKRLMHARMTINGGLLMLSDDFPEYMGGQSGAPSADHPTGTVLHIQVDDADAAFDRAVAAGATVVMAPADMFWGDRYCQVKDPFGHKWSIAHKLQKG